MSSNGTCENDIPCLSKSITCGRWEISGLFLMTVWVFSVHSVDPPQGSLTVG